MAVKPVPAGFHTVTPYLTVTDAGALLDFLRRGIGAAEHHIMRGPDGKIAHGDVLIGDSHVMFGQAPDPSTAMSSMLYLYVPDCDALYSRAISAGATSISEPQTQFYGDRSGAVRDCCGNQWYFATHIEDVSDEELGRRAMAARPPQG
jgi:PhnB protein